MLSGVYFGLQIICSLLFSEFFQTEKDIFRTFLLWLVGWLVFNYSQSGDVPECYAENIYFLVTKVSFTMLFQQLFGREAWMLIKHVSVKMALQSSDSYFYEIHLALFFDHGYQSAHLEMSQTFISYHSLFFTAVKLEFLLHAAYRAVQECLWWKGR